MHRSTDRRSVAETLRGHCAKLDFRFTFVLVDRRQFLLISGSFFFGFSLFFRQRAKASLRKRSADREQVFLKLESPFNDLLNDC
jgi:hypothetical protein